MTDDIDDIPLKNLPESGLKVFKYVPWKEGQPIQPNNVLIALLDQMETVSIVGRNLDGEYVFASSIRNASDVQRDLFRFNQVLEDLE